MKGVPPEAGTGTRLVSRRGTVAEGDSKVIDLAAERARRDPVAGQAAFDAGDAFMFEALETVTGRVGVIRTDRPIVVAGGAGIGFAMTVETAKALIVELQRAIQSPLLPRS